METAERLGLSEIAAKVNFSTEQVARMCGVSRRQLSYWAQKGIIPSEEGYSLTTVEKVTLIRRELAKGHTLRRAVQRSDRRLDERHRFDTSVGRLTLEEVGERCVSYLERVESLLLAVRDLASRLPSADQAAVRDTIAGLRLGEVLGSSSASLSPNEILVCLRRAVEHLELVLDDLREAV